MLPTRNHKALVHELFTIYKIQRLILTELGLIAIASGLIPLFERSHPSASITTIGEGLWWALVTVTSTGYGDLVPITVGGKIIGVVLMFSGIALFSTVITLIASFFAFRRTRRHTARLDTNIDTLREKLEAMDKKLDFVVRALDVKDKEPEKSD